MSSRVTDPHPPSGPGERELLARLGLGPGASDAELEAAHDEILDYLGRAPSALAAWAARQVDEVDEAYARLNGAPASATGPDLSPAEALPATRASAPAKGVQIRGGLDDLGEDDELDALTDDGGPVIVSRRQQRSARGRGQAAARAPRQAPADAVLISRRTLRNAGAAVVALALVAAVAIGVYGAPGGVPGLTGTPKPEASGGLDTAQVATLMQKIAENPQDTTSLMSLGNLYYASGDYATAMTWYQKITAIDPQNVDALLALGAAQYNTGDDAAAEASWREVLAIDANNLEAHYDLGFMYFSQQPPNVEQARAEWGKVIELAPDSDIAQTVKAHLDSLGGSPAPSGAAGGSAAPGSPAPAASGVPASSAPSPAASLAPSPAVSPGG
jgi:cytochrome c-type biogenesis protein CcmH/NrfG